MSYSLQVHSEAIIDIQDAFQWYEEKREGLGFEFINEVENGYEEICKHPKYYTAINEYFRRFKMHKFPYIIIYEIEKNDVIITAVRHGRRIPKV